MISVNTPSETQANLGLQLKTRRKWSNHSRAEAARLSGVPTPTIRRFEDSGEISLRQFLMLCHAYGDLSLFDHVFPQPAAKSIDELVAAVKKSEKR